MRTICNIAKIIVIVMLVLCLMGKIDYRIVMAAGVVLCILEKIVADEKKISENKSK